MHIHVKITGRKSGIVALIFTVTYYKEYTPFSMLLFCFLLIVFSWFRRKDEDEVDSAVMVIKIYTESRERADNVVKILDDIHERLKSSNMSLYNFSVE